MSDASTAPKVSMIVPCFNVAPYVDQCLNSLRGQTLVDIEIIAIDDGSTDETHAILMRHAKEDGRIRVIQQANAGLSATRNRGIDLAGGDLIMFVDSDDWLVLDAAERCWSEAKKKNAEVVFFQYQSWSEDNPVFLPPPDAHAWRILAGRSYAGMCEDWLFLETHSCAKAYRRIFLAASGIRFWEGKRYEENLFHYQIIHCVRFAGFVCAPLYVYRKNRPGQITKDGSRLVYDTLVIFDRMLDGRDVRETSFSAPYLATLSRAIPWVVGNIPLEGRHEYLDALHDLMQARLGLGGLRSGLRAMSCNPMASPKDLAQSLLVFAPCELTWAFLGHRKPNSEDWFRLVAYMWRILGRRAGMYAVIKCAREAGELWRSWRRRR